MSSFFNFETSFLENPFLKISITVFSIEKTTTKSQGCNHEIYIKGFTEWQYKKEGFFSFFSVFLL